MCQKIWRTGSVGRSVSPARRPPRAGSPPPRVSDRGSAGRPPASTRPSAGRAPCARPAGRRASGRSPRCGSGSPPARPAGHSRGARCHRPRRSRAPHRPRRREPRTSCLPPPRRRQSGPSVSANAPGFSDWSPSDSADSGSGCTSTIRPSAPAATAAKASGATSDRRRRRRGSGRRSPAGASRASAPGSPTMSSVLRVAVSKVRMPRSHSTTLWLPLRHDVLGRHQQLRDRRRQAALEQHRTLHAAQLGEQREVLHVARADLQHVGVLGDEVDVARVHHLGHDGQPRLGAHLGEQLAAPRVPSPWKLYGDERGLNAPPRRIVAPGGRAPRAPSSCSIVAVLDRARPGDDGERVAAESRRVAPRRGRRCGSTANSRDASLYGLSTGITDSTPGSERRGTSWSSASSPMHPMIVRCSPRERWVRMPAGFHALPDMVELVVGDVRSA